MALAEVREQIQKFVANATNAPVWEYERVVKTKKQIEDIGTTVDSKGERLIHVWMITVEADDAVPDTPEEQADFTFDRIYTFVLRGYRSLDDAEGSGMEWQDTIEAILSIFDTNPTLGGKAVRSGPPIGRVRDDHRAFGDWGCHYAEISLDATLKVSRVA